MIKDKDPVLLNVTYIPPTKSNDRQEYFEVIYKDSSGEVRKSNEPAVTDIFIVKPEFRNYDYNKPQEEIKKMDRVKTPISQIRQKIANAMGDEGKRFIKEAYDNRQFSRLNQLYKWKYCYGCDFQPEFYFLRDWYYKHPQPKTKLSVAFLDIECDLVDYKLDIDNIPDTAFSPVNCVTVILDETKEAWTFVLDPQEPSKMGRSEEEYRERFKMYLRQKSAHEYLKTHMDEVIKDLHESFDPTYGYINYHIRTYEKEIDLIANVFRLINKRKPNYCLSWNMRFDVQYLYHRITMLGYDPASIMCHPDFPEESRRCEFKVDRSTWALEKQYDFFYCSSYTQYICQMRLYAAIRKSRHKLKSVSLNAIADIELKDKKVEYAEYGNMIKFIYDNWLLFIKYNIKDVLLQVGIERKCHDVMTYYMKSHANWTPYNKIFKETHLLRNVREQYFEKEGWIQGNNLNIIDKPKEDDEQASALFYSRGDGDDDDDDETSFKGAINADPIWNDTCGMRILGVRSNNVHQNAMDYDMGAFYPSIKIASNMDPATLDYKASFDNDEFISGEFRNRSLNTKYVERDKYGNERKLDFTGEAVNTYVSKNPLTFGYNYLSLPNMTDFAVMIIKRIKG